MSSIFENAGKIHIAVVKDKETGQGNLALALSALAVRAITKGPGSEEWKSYMSLFADNAAQLTLLTVPQDGEEFYLTKSRAYLVSNAVCAAGTNTATTNGVEKTNFSAVADNNPDGTVTKPAEIAEMIAAQG
jgi:hypothetical protein